MSNDHLTVVEDEQAAPEGLHLRVIYDSDSVRVQIHNGADAMSGTGYFFVKNYESWEAARDAAVARAMEKIEIIAKYGAPPPTEYVAVDA